MLFQCEWTTVSGDVFNLQPLVVVGDNPSYFIKDGDIPCTPAIEPTYSYVWNLCAPITSVSFPKICEATASKMSTALQFLNRSKDGYRECEMIGMYDEGRDDSEFSLIDMSDPSVGVSLKYTIGDKCGKTGNLYRSATIDIYCSDVHVEIESANEPTMCQYHFTMRSYHGCPTVCAFVFSPIAI